MVQREGSGEKSPGERRLRNGTGEKVRENGADHAARIVHGLCTDCTRIAHRLYTDRAQIAHGLYTDWAADNGYQAVCNFKARIQKESKERL